GGLTDGEVGHSDLKGGIRKAWLGSPTRRYRHGVIGDDVEAGSLTAMRPSPGIEGVLFTYTLPSK
ncbi:MAG: hypothetical protein GY755_24175, partial [Chloroflexi bacterium]|nr:hypothetical protein [Chloroflexota bacterium]